MKENNADECIICLEPLKKYEVVLLYGHHNSIQHYCHLHCGLKWREVSCIKCPYCACTFCYLNQAIVLPPHLFVGLTTHRKAQNLKKWESITQNIITKLQSTIPEALVYSKIIKWRSTSCTTRQMLEININYDYPRFNFANPLCFYKRYFFEIKGPYMDQNKIVYHLHLFILITINEEKVWVNFPLSKNSRNNKALPIDDFLGVISPEKVTESKPNIVSITQEGTTYYFSTRVETYNLNSDSFAEKEKENYVYSCELAEKIVQPYLESLLPPENFQLSLIVNHFTTIMQYDNTIVSTSIIKKILPLVYIISLTILLSGCNHI